MESTLDKANNLLMAIRIHAANPWEEKIAEFFTPEETARYVASCKALSSKAGLLHPWGVVTGSNRQLGEFLPSLLPSELPVIIGTLKKYGKLFQCGRGGGKCFVVVDVQPIESSTKVESNDDPVKLAKSLKSTVEGLVGDLDILKARNAELECAVQEKDKELAELRRNASVATRLTWS